MTARNSSGAEPVQRVLAITHVYDVRPALAEPPMRS
jgi:hypothetical protein